MIGGHVSRELFEGVKLLAIYLNVSQSEVVRSLLTDRLSQENIGRVIDALGERVHDAWKQYREEKGKESVSFEEYCQEAQKELMIRRVSTTHMQLILTKAQKLYEADKTKFVRSGKAKSAVEAGD